MSQGIECVLFDMDGVLCDYERNTRLDELGKAMGTDRETARQVMYTSNLEWEADAGAMTIDEYMAALSKGFGRTLSEAQWLHARIAATQVRPSMVTLAERLAGRVKIGLLTNNSMMMERHLRTVSPGLFPLFDGRAWVSAQMGAIKPHAECYLQCVATMGVDPARTLFVDDSDENTEGALVAGLQAYQFVDQARFEKLLVELGVL
jgi:HAD superfamily hydrolase (TIGR01509 family)